MTSTLSIHVILIAAIIAVTGAVEVRVLTGLNMRGQTNVIDSDQRLVLNSNNRYIYPSQQVPEYNVFSL